MSMKDLALRETALKALLDVVGAELRAVKAEMQDALETSGASQVRAVLPDGTRVGTISLSTSKTAAQVVDEEKLLEWVRENAPSEIKSRTVTEVQPAYRASLLAQMTAAGAAEVPDKATGEITEVPGVEMYAGRATTHRILLAKDATDRIIDAWRAGELSHLDLPQLGAGGGAL